MSVEIENEIQDLIRAAVKQRSELYHCPFWPRPLLHPNIADYDGITRRAFITPEYIALHKAAVRWPVEFEKVRLAELSWWLLSHDNIEEVI